MIGSATAQAVITAPNEVEYRPQSVPEVRPDRIVVRVRACALCTWEQRVFAGIDTKQYPFVGGHEFAGYVEAIGAETKVPGLKVGDLVAVAALQRCGQCPSCRRGLDNLCDQAYSKVPGTVSGPGGLGAYVSVPGYQIYKMAEGVDPYEAALTEPVACVTRSIKKAHVLPGDNVIIVGAGIMGLLHTILAKHAGARVFVSEFIEGRRNKALELGADGVIDPGSEDYVERVMELTGGVGANQQFMAIGVAKAIEQACSAAAKGGYVAVYASVYPKPAMVTINADLFHNREITLSGTISQDHDDFRRAADLIGNKIVNLKPVISAHYPLRELPAAMESAMGKETYRVLIDVTEP